MPSRGEASGAALAREELKVYTQWEPRPLLQRGFWQPGVKEFGGGSSKKSDELERKGL